jgi:hypothetical protein
MLCLTKPVLVLLLITVLLAVVPVSLSAQALNTQTPLVESGPQPATEAAAPAPAVAPTPAPATTQNTGPRKLKYDLNVLGSQQWTDTSIQLQAGDRVSFTSSGNISYLLRENSGPNGLARTWRDLLRALPVNSAGGGTLIGRVGESGTAVPFAIGAEKEVTVSHPGKLYLGINQLADEQSDGSYKVKLQITPAANAQKASAVVKPQTPALGADFLQQIPRRVSDADGRPGDMVNFVVLGSKEQVQKAFEAAGWVLVDRTKGEAVLHAILNSSEKEAYLQMPMSELYLFGRAQDFGFARAEPVQVVASRNHLRLWQAPFEVNGQTAWAGAATHDIGFEKDQRNGGVTHKIDPNVDNEREFVGSTLTQTGMVAGTTYLTPADPLREAHTATGGTFQSDGRVLVITLQ